MSIPTTLPISLSTVIAEVNPTNDTLQGCFDDATGTFDSTYAKTGEYLTEFRGYASSGGNLVFNGGGTGTTDWFNATDGLANGWSDYGPSPPAVNSIVTGNGFTSNAQKRLSNFTSKTSASAIYSTTNSIDNGSTYSYSFKYRSNITLYYLKVDSNGDYTTYWDVLDANTGNAKSASGSITGTAATDGTHLFIIGVPIGTSVGSTDWFEIDEVTVTED